MPERVEKGGEGKVQRRFLIKKQTSEPALEPERRFKDTEQAARPGTAQELHRECALRDRQLSDRGDLGQGGILFQREVPDQCRRVRACHHIPHQ